MQNNAKKSGLPWFLVLVIIVLALAGYTAHNANALSYLSDDSAACNNCHVMNDVYASWRKSSHAQIVAGKPRATCNDCHLPHDGFVSKWVSKAKSGVSHAYSFTFKLDDLPQHFDANTVTKAAVQANCIRCHAQLVGVVVNATTKPDDPHFSDSLQCAKCHAGVGHTRGF